MKIVINFSWRAEKRGVQVFDNVKVNEENENLRKNRLELINMLCKTFKIYKFFNYWKQVVNKLILNFKSKKSKKIKSPKNFLGGKGANLSEMGRMGLPVPPGLLFQQSLWNILQR